jgi:hypothetical protein
MPPLYPHEFLKYMSVPSYPGVYLLGSFARHVTIFSQQIRAMNLIDGLCRTGQLGRGTGVIVVGGGVAGLTAAAAALVRGARVTVIEQGSDLCPIQSEAGDRYLHPHIYDWPLTDPHEGEADLPLMAWKAGEARDVFKELKRSWRVIAQKMGANQVLGFRVADIRRDATTAMLQVVPELPAKDGEAETLAQIVILGIGFGRERSRGDYQTYWQNSPIDSEQEKKFKWLVSGCGDGALTDLMRLCVQHFRHSDFVEPFAQDENLATELKNLLAPSVPARRTFERLHPRAQGSLSITVRRDTEVVLNAPDDYLENSGSSILNRFIVFYLEKMGAFTRRPGKMVSEPDVPFPVDGKYHVVFEQPAGEDDFDRLVIRHGPKPALNPDDVPALHKACEQLRVAWEDLRSSGTADRTRIPFFDPSDYTIDRAPNSTTEPDDEFAAAGRGPRYVVIESSQARKPRPLSQLVKAAVSGQTFRRDMEVVLARMPPEDPFVEAIGVNEALASQGSYNRVVRALCRAEIAVIDVTDYEPGIMLLLGIRTIARRGVTIVTTNTAMTATEWSKLPFNLKEMYPLAADKPTELGQLISSAWSKYNSMPHYEDLPAWRAARQTGKTDAAIDPEKSILWLCPFDKAYGDGGFEEYLRYEISDKFDAGSKLERVTDIVSPQLLAQRLYSAIRFRKLCIIDWTFWSSNVFFEFGVRLAINRFGPVCMLAPVHEAAVPEGIRVQRNHLQKMFAPILYRSSGDAPSPWPEIRNRYEQMKNAESPRRRSLIPPAFGTFPYHHTYNRVTEFLDLRQEPGGVEPQEFLNGLLDSLIGPGVSKPGSPVLFADSRPVAAQVKKAATAVSTAAWFYMNYRYEKSDLLKDEELRKQYEQIGDRLLDLLRQSDSQKDQDLAEKVEIVLNELRSPKEQRVGLS